MVGPSKLLRRVFFEPLLSATRDSSIVLTIYSYTEKQKEEADKRQVQSQISLLFTYAHLATARQTDSALVILPQVEESLLHSGLSVDTCWWRAHRCQSFPGDVRQIKALVCIAPLGFHLELWVYACPFGTIQILRGYVLIVIV